MGKRRAFQNELILSSIDHVVIRCGDGAQLSERASLDVLAITILFE